MKQIGLELIMHERMFSKGSHIMRPEYSGNILHINKVWICNYNKKLLEKVFLKISEKRVTKILL